MKWKTRASTTLYGNSNFLSMRTRMNRELGPEGPVNMSYKKIAKFATCIIHLCNLEKCSRGV